MLKTKLLKRLFVFEVEALLSRVQLFSIPWTVTCQAPLTMGFPRQEYRSGFPLTGALPDPGMEPASLALAGRFFTTEPPGKPINSSSCTFKTVHVTVCKLHFN